MPERGDVHDLGIARVNDDAADVVGIAKTHVGPGFAPVEGAIHAVTPGRALAVVRFAGSRPDDVRIRRRDRQVADRKGSPVAIEDRFPRRPAVHALEDPAGCRAHEDDLRVRRHRLHVVNAPAEGRGADVAPLQTVDRRCRTVVRRRGWNGRDRKERNEA
jgi:hypothetical protein